MNLNLSLIELYRLKWKLQRQKKFSLLEKVEQAINEKEYQIFEDGGGTSATGGPSVGGMGNVVNAQPSGLAGATIGPNWATTGGTVGSGDVSVPYNPSGANRVFQKIPAEMGSNHGPRTGKKSRKKRISMKSLKDIFAKRQDFMADQEKTKETSKRVMNFDDYAKGEFNKIKK